MFILFSKIVVIFKVLTVSIQDRVLISCLTSASIFPVFYFLHLHILGGLTCLTRLTLVWPIYSDHFMLVMFHICSWRSQLILLPLFSIN